MFFTVQCVSIQQKITSCEIKKIQGKEIFKYNLELGLSCKFLFKEVQVLDLYEENVM